MIQVDTQNMLMILPKLDVYNGYNYVDISAGCRL